MRISRRISKRRTTTSKHHKTTPVILLAACFVLLLCQPLASQARFNYQASDKTQIHFDGFGTLAVGGSDSNDIGFRRDTGQARSYQRDKTEWRVDSSLGAQMLLKHDDWLNFVVQFVLRDRKKNGFKDILQYAFLAFHPNRDWTIRLGRNPHDVFFMSDTQNVGFSHTWLRPARATYNELFFDYYNGAEVTYRHRIGNGLLSTKLFTGQLDASVGLDGLPENVAFDYKPFFGSKLQFELDSLRLTLSYQQGEVSEPPTFLDAISDVWAKIPASIYHGAPAIADIYSFKNNKIELIAGGIFYDTGKWSLQSEFTSTSLKDIIGLQVHAGYIGFSYQLPNNLRPYIRVSRLYNSVSKLGFDENTLSDLHPSIQGLASLLLDSYYEIQASHVDTAIGLRWDFRHNMALKFQWDHFDVDKNGTFLLTRLSPAASKGGTFNLFAVSLDFIF